MIVFRLTQAIYMIPIAAAAQKPRSIPWQLQRLFYEMQSSTRAPDTKGMNFDTMRQYDGLFLFKERNDEKRSYARGIWKSVA